MLSKANIAKISLSNAVDGCKSRPYNGYTMSALGFFREDCRLCHSTNLETFLDFGMHPHSDGFLREEQLQKPEPFFPLACAVCKDCGQVQLTYTVKPEHLYNEDYVYDGSVTKTGQDHFLGMAKSIVEKFAVPKDSLVIDIGSNVGLLLSGFKECGAKVLGIDPAIEPTKRAKERGIDSVVECFTADIAKKVAAEHGKAKVITGTNVFAHVDDLDDLMQGADALLDTDGVLVFESPYLKDLVEHMEYDTIYHQHVSYLAISPLVKFFARFDMELFDVERTTIHGGSIRMFIARKGTHPITDTVKNLIADEEKTGLWTPENLRTFAKNVETHRRELITMLQTLHDEGKTVVGIGAPAKGMTLLSYCGIHASLMPFLTEKSDWKQGKFAPGVHIPITSDDHLLEVQPDYALILSWNFAPEIMKNLDAYKLAGGTFIIPVPSPTFA